MFSGDAIVFTRVVNYNFEDPNFVNRFSQDLFRTHEYLKRIFPDILIEDVNFINVLPQHAIDIIEDNKEENLHFTNYTPYQAANKAKLANIVSQDSSFCDVIIASAFANSRKKVLKFTTPRIRLLERLYMTTKILFAINVILPLVFISFLIYLFFYDLKIDRELTDSIKKKAAVEEKFNEVRSSILDDDKIGSSQIDKIIDFGKVDEVLAKNEIDIFQFFTKLSLMGKHGVIVNSFSYNLSGYDPKSSRSNRLQFKFIVTGKIEIKSGNVEELFGNFDNLVADTKKEFKDYNVKYADLPTDIDFSKEYYEFPINLEITSR